jgi:hypothetical protein
VGAIRDGPDVDVDEGGRFHFPHLRPGRHEIAAVGRGCRVAKGSFTVAAGQTKLLKLVLPAEAEPLRDRRSDGSGVVITHEQLDESRASDLLEAIRDRVPLLNADLSGEGGSFRGGPAEVVVILDGVRTAGSLERHGGDGLRPRHQRRARARDHPDRDALERRVAGYLPVALGPPLTGLLASLVYGK